MRLWCLAVLTHALASSPVLAAAPPPEDRATIESLYDEGRALYDTADYDGAIAKWTEAYAMVGDSAESAEIRATLLYNLASAHEAAFDIDADPTHLTKARVLLQRFDDRIDDFYEGEAAVAERERVRGRIAGIDEKLAAARGEPGDQPDSEDQPDSGDQPDSEDQPEPEDAPEDQPAPPPRPDDTTSRKPRGLVISGAVLMGLGLGGVGLGVGAMIEAQAANTFDEEALDISEASLDLRHAQIRRGQLMNTLTYVGFIAGGTLLVTGATLIGLSARNKRAGRVALLPALSPTHAGLVVGGSF